ncbi:hypothetical protein C8E83_2280 [Frondihabitans australicus]|uniref:Outer membrane channel protein CpnT-like N-terminal domain-containing protein n=2 Tax=Frondihabitans australicus TaxID=386892 RepID=A0A495IGL8_9MICO|nr:hypothetical protein C8E83_2280 [Frondihabitans australicus]
MAGTDPAGVSWAASYDAAAAQAVRLADACVDALGHVAAGLAVTGLNYATVEHLNSGGTGFAPGHSLPVLPAPLCSAPPVSAAGSGGLPSLPGFSLVAGLIGGLWPDGSPARLREAADAWSAFADAVGAVQVVAVSDALADERTPEMPRILEKVSAAGAAVRTLEGEARSLAAACRSCADHIDDVHRQTLAVLNELGEQVAATAAVGIALTLVTAGASDLAAGGAAAGEVGLAASRILGFIRTMTPLVIRVTDDVAITATTLSRATGFAREITVRLSTVAGRTVNTAVTGAATNVAIGAITDPSSLTDADTVASEAAWGALGGAALSAVAHGGDMAITAIDRYRFWHGPDRPVIVPGRTVTIPRRLFNDTYTRGAHQMTETQGMLGKYVPNSPDSYIARAGTDHAYFDMGSDWNMMKAFLHLTDEDMFNVYNTKFLDELIADGRPFRFSHNPELYSRSALFKELTYLKAHGYRFDARTMTAKPAMPGINKGTR